MLKSIIGAMDLNKGYFLLLFSLSVSAEYAQGRGINNVGVFGHNFNSSNTNHIYS